MCDFKINQEVVCIRTHSQKAVIEGNIYTIKAISKSNCNCVDISVDVGINSGNIIGTVCHCQRCLKTGIIADGIWWLSPGLFKPLDSIADISELTEILTNKQPFEL